MIKLVATDIDGTLIRESSSVLPEEIFDLIRELRKRDIYFAAASGRQYMGLKRLFAPVADQMLFISENGFSLFFDWSHTILYYAPTIALNNQFATAINIPAIRVFHPDPSQTFTEKASCSELWRNNESSGSINIAPFAAFHILCSR